MRAQEEGEADLEPNMDENGTDALLQLCPFWRSPEVALTALRTLRRGVATLRQRQDMRTHMGHADYLLSMELLLGVSVSFCLTSLRQLFEANCYGDCVPRKAEEVEAPVQSSECTSTCRIDEWVHDEGSDRAQPVLPVYERFLSLKKQIEGSRRVQTFICCYANQVDVREEGTEIEETAASPQLWYASPYHHETAQPAVAEISAELVRNGCANDLLRSPARTTDGEGAAMSGHHALISEVRRQLNEACSARMGGSSIYFETLQSLAADSAHPAVRCRAACSAFVNELAVGSKNTGETPNAVGLQVLVMERVESDAEGTQTTGHLFKLVWNASELLVSHEAARYTYQCGAEAAGLANVFSRQHYPTESIRIGSPPSAASSSPVKSAAQKLTETVVERMLATDHCLRANPWEKVERITLFSRQCR